MKAIITTLILTLISTFATAQLVVKAKVYSTNVNQSQDSLTFNENANASTLTVLRNETDTLKFHAVPLETLNSVTIWNQSTEVYENSVVTNTEAVVCIGVLPAGTYTLYFNYGSGAVIGCELIVLSGTLGINEASKEDVQLSVFPNPVVDYVTVRFNTENNDVPVYVYTLGGQLVHTDNASRFAGANDVTVDFGSFNAGIYLVKVGGSTFKVIKN